MKFTHGKPAEIVIDNHIVNVIKCVNLVFPVRGNAYVM